MTTQDVVRVTDSIQSIPVSLTLKTKTFHLSSSRRGDNRQLTTVMAAPIDILACSNVSVEPNAWSEWVRDVRPSNMAIWSDDVVRHGHITNRLVLPEVQFFANADASFLVEYRMSYEIDESQKPYVSHLKQDANYSVKQQDLLVHSHLEFKPNFPSDSVPCEFNWHNGEGGFMYNTDLNSIRAGTVGERDDYEYRYTRVSVVNNPDKLASARLKSFFCNTLFLYLAMYTVCYLPYIVCWKWCYPTYTYNHRRKLVLGRAQPPVFQHVPNEPSLE